MGGFRGRVRTTVWAIGLQRSICICRHVHPHDILFEIRDIKTLLHLFKCLVSLIMSLSTDSGKHLQCTGGGPRYHIPSTHMWGMRISPLSGTTFVPSQPTRSHRRSRSVPGPKLNTYTPPRALNLYDVTSMGRNSTTVLRYSRRKKGTFTLGLSGQGPR